MHFIKEHSDLYWTFVEKTYWLIYTEKGAQELSSSGRKSGHIGTEVNCNFQKYVFVSAYLGI